MHVVAEHEAPLTVRCSKSFAGSSVLSSAERGRRTALARARREVVRQQLALARADEEVAAGEFQEARGASTSGSVARLAT